MHDLYKNMCIEYRRNEKSVETNSISVRLFN